jgi:GNAT superfamily N-acetyltransferase
VPDEHLANLSYARRANGWYKIFNHAPEDSNFTYVAEEEPGEIVGFVNGGVERTGDPVYKGELMAIYILQNHQGKGINWTLFSTGACSKAPSVGHQFNAGMGFGR